MVLAKWIKNKEKEKTQILLHVKQVIKKKEYELNIIYLYLQF